MYPFTDSPSTNIVPIAGQRVGARLINSVRSHYVDLTASGIETIAGGAATAIRNRGSIFSAFDEITITENGQDRILLHGRVARVLSEAAAPSKLPATRFNALAAAAYPLREKVRLWFAHPFARDPGETAFREHDSRHPLEVQVKLAANGGGDKLASVAGAVTGVLSAVNVTVDHRYDGNGNDLPYFIPNIRQIVLPVAGANAQLPAYIQTNNALRAIVISQEDTVDGEVSDIITSLSMKGDFRNVIGPSQRLWTDAVDAMADEFGGDVQNYAHLIKWFQYHGELSKLFNPQQDNNFRIEFNCQPSVAGHGNSQIRITLLEMVADTGLCKPLDFSV